MLDRTVVFGSLAGAAVIAGHLINAVAAHVLEPPFRLPDASQLAPPAEELIPVSALLERNLFHSRATAPLIETAQCTKAVLTSRLVATVIGAGGAEAWFTGEDGLRRIAVGGEIDGAEVIAVERGAVRLAREGACAEVQLAELEVRPQQQQGPKLVERRGEDEASVRRSDLEAALGDPMRFASDQRIVPKPSEHGFALFSVKTGGIADQLGFKNGDVIQRLNGHQLDEPGMFGVYDLVRSQELSVDYVRRGERRTLTVRIE